MKLYFTPVATVDLDGIFDHIATHRPRTASRVVTTLRETCELIAGQPEMGERRSEFPGDYRSFCVERWGIFYRITDSCVEIHRVVDAARDIDRLFG